MLSNPSPTIRAELLSVDHAARFIDRTPKAVRLLAWRKRIPHRKCGGRIVFIRGELEAWMYALQGVGLDEALANVKRQK